MRNGIQKDGRTEFKELRTRACSSRASPAGDAFVELSLSVAATIGTNEAIQIWRMSDGEPLQELMGHSVWVGAFDFSPEGTYLASTGSDGILRVWFTSMWTLAYAATNVHGEVAFSPDGTYPRDVRLGWLPDTGSNEQQRCEVPTSTESTWRLPALPHRPDGTRANPPGPSLPRSAPMKNPPSFSCLWRFANMHGNAGVRTITGKPAPIRTQGPVAALCLAPFPIASAASPTELAPPTAGQAPLPAAEFALLSARPRRPAALPCLQGWQRSLKP